MLEARNRGKFSEGYLGSHSHGPNSENAAKLRGYIIIYILAVLSVAEIAILRFLK